MKQKVVIIGSGWAGATLSTALDESKYSVTIVSPETETSYTPLLASAAAGLYDFAVVQTPIRHTGRRTAFCKARVENIDFKSKKVKCIPSFKDIAIKEFELDYDILAVSPGTINNDFGTPGVFQHAHLIRNVKDAQAISALVQDCFEKASIPGLTDAQQRAILHFVIVGAGPTGVEVSSELHDLFAGGYAQLYPHLKGKVTITIHDIADNVLPGFDSELQKHALETFDKHDVEIQTGSHIEKIEKGALFTKEKGKIEAGLIIWATGNKATSLVESLAVKKTPKNPRIVTDDFLRAFSDDGDVLDGVYALGDAADVENASLPPTAEVATQKANYLGRMLNNGFSRKFEYKQKAVVAYLGQSDGVISGKDDYSGAQAWIAWRSKNFSWTRTWRQKIMMVVCWSLDLLTGRANAPR